MDLNSTWTSTELCWDALERWVKGVIFWEGQLAFDIRWKRDTKQSEEGIARCQGMVDAFLTGDFSR